jgi:hypothetical protein
MYLPIEVKVYVKTSTGASMPQLVTAKHRQKPICTFLLKVYVKTSTGASMPRLVTAKHKTKHQQKKMISINALHTLGVRAT